LKHTHTRKMQRLQKKSQCAVEEKLVSCRQSADGHSDRHPATQVEITLGQWGNIMCRVGSGWLL